MNLKIVHVRRLIAAIAVACALASAALPLSQGIVSNCPASGVPITKSLTLNSNCNYPSEPGIVLGASNIILNCAGHTITGSGMDKGISVSNYFKVTIEYCKVTDFQFGFYAYESPSTTLSANTATGNNFGFFLDRSFNSHLSGNTATGNSADGFHLFDSVGTSLSSNTATGSANGFYLTYGVFKNSQMTLTSNKADNNGYGYYDNTVGAGTVQLGNTYSGNECHGNVIGSVDGFAGFGPAGLCTPQG